MKVSRRPVSAGKLAGATASFCILPGITPSRFSEKTAGGPVRPRIIVVKASMFMAAGRGVETRSTLVALCPAICTRGTGPWAGTVN